MRTAIQGIAGCFSAAAAARLAPNGELVPCQTFVDVFAALRDGRADQAVVPVENSLVGPIAAVRKLLAQLPVRTLADMTLPIEQCLILAPEGELDLVRRVLSHPVALAQCARFLARHPDWQPVPFFDTAGSVRELVASARPDVAAIAGALAAAEYGARVLERGISDRDDNATRFVLIAPSG